MREPPCPTWDGQDTRLGSAVVAPCPRRRGDRVAVQLAASAHGRLWHSSAVHGILQNGDAAITVVDAAAGQINIGVHHTATAPLNAGRYVDALQVSIGDVVSPLWIGTVLVAANPRQVLPA